MLRVLLVVGCALLWPTVAEGKDFAALIAVGSDGRSVGLRLPSGVIDGLFDVGIQGGATVRPRGGYVRLFTMAYGGYPGAPGRYYPATGATCMGWKPSLATGNGTCLRVTAALRRAFGRARGLRLFHHAPPSLRRVLFKGREVANQSNLAVGIELAFARWQLRRPARRPLLCTGLAVTWSTTAGGTLPSRLCVGRRGVYARGRLYPLPGGVFELSRQLPST